MLIWRPRSPQASKPAVFAIVSHSIIDPSTPQHLKADLARGLGLLAIYETNAVKTKGNLSSGLFLCYSRLNHSCSPNVYNCFNEVTGKIMVHAFRDIEAGEEITTSYIELLRTPEQRAKDLEKWCFTCTCEACKDPKAAASRKRRQRLFATDQAIAYHHMTDPDMRARFKSLDTLPKTISGKLSCMEEYIKLLEEEGLIDMYLAEARV